MESRHHSTQQKSAINSLVPRTRTHTRTKDNKSYYTRQKNIFSILLYIKEIIDQIDRILNKHNIRTIFKPPKNIGHILKNFKD